MDRETRRSVEEYRRTTAGPIENNLIDELVNGELDRLEFLRRGAMFGLSASVVGSLLAFVGEAGAAPTAPSTAAVKRGGTLRVGMNYYAGSNEPYKLGGGGSLAFAAIPGEYLTFSNSQLQVKPWLATSWKANATPTVWTFQLRRGVKFHNGKTMTADDVVASFKHYCREQAVAGAVGLPRDPRARRGDQARPLHRRVPAQATDRRLSLPRQPDDLPGDHPAESVRPQAGFLGAGRDDRYRGLPAREVPGPEERRARPLRAVLGRPSAARPSAAHLLRKLWRAGAGLAWRPDRPCAAALPAAVGAVSQQQPLHDLYRPDCIASSCSACGSTATRSGTRGYVGRSPSSLNRPGPDPASSCSARARSETTRRSGRSTRRPTRRSSSASRTSRSRAHLLEAAGQENLKFTITTRTGLDLPDTRRRSRRSGRAGGHGHLARGAVDRRVLRGGADYYATTPWINRPATITE